MERLKRGYEGLHKLHLHDEAPRIGCGHRKVLVKVGNRKVKLKCPYTGRIARIMRKDFDKLWEASSGNLSCESS